MFANNNKPQRRSSRRDSASSSSQRATSRRRDEGRERASGRNAAQQSHARTRTREEAATSYDRSSYTATRASHSSRRGGGNDASAYGAAKYGSGARHSEHRGAGQRRAAGSTPHARRGADGFVPVTPGAAHNQYSRNASDREFVRVQHERKRKAKRKRVAMIALAIVGVLCLGGVGAAWAYVMGLEGNMRENVDDELLGSLAVVDSPSDPFYMLLIGVDKSEDREASNEYGGSYRTDSIILTRVDPRNKTVTMISVPRDTRVTIEGHGQQKINAAYAYGGPAGAVKAVSQLADVPISHYAEIDFNGFEEIVDALGGIEVDVPYEINDEEYTGHLDAGQQTLNGEQALILCRSRHAYDNIGDGDAIRAANQRMVLATIMKKVMSSDVATLTNTVSTLSEYVTTDFSMASILGLAQGMMGIDVDKNVYTASVPTTSKYENDIWWEILDTTAWNKMMQRVEEGLSPTEETQVDPNTGTVLSSAGDGGTSDGSSSSSSSSSSSVSLSGKKISVKNGSGVTGVANEAAQKLTPKGAVVETGNADDSNYKTTIVVYNDSSNAETAQQIVDLLGKGQTKKNNGTYSFTGDFLVVVGKDW